MTKHKLLLFLAVSLMVSAASAEILVNGDFEADAGSIVSTVAPTSWEWELPTYGGADPYAANETIDPSAIGGGGGGSVGILLGNWDSHGAWNDGIQGYFPSVAAGTYTVSITYAVTDPGISNWMRAQLYDVIDNSDPATVWTAGNYTTVGIASPSANVATTTDTWHTMDLEITTTAPANTLFINSAGYDPGNIIIGAVSMVPEPATLALLGIGGLSLIRRKRK